MTVKETSIKIYEVESEDSGSRGRRWKIGFKYNAPYISFVALLLILGIISGIITVILTSDGQDVDEWSSHSATVLGHSKTLSIPVNVWISGFMFFSGKLMALMFAEAVTIAWWIRAMKGRTLRQLTHDFDAGRSITAVIKSPKLFSWICLASIAFTGFSGLGMILQKATSTHTVQEIIRGVNMSTSYYEHLPYGWSGNLAQYDQFGRWSVELNQILDDFQQKKPIDLEVGNCAKNVTCATTYRGIGFSYECGAARGNLKTDPHANSSSIRHVWSATWWRVGVGWFLNTEPLYGLFPTSVLQDQQPISPVPISVGALWKPETGCYGEKLVRQYCSLKPAIVEYPIEMVQGQVRLLPASSTVKWISEYKTAPNIPADRVVEIVENPVGPWEKNGRNENWNTPTTYGGIYSVIENLYQSQINYTYSSEEGISWDATNLFALTYMNKRNWSSVSLDYCDLKFDSPMEDIANGIREFMFRTSVTLQKQQVKDASPYLDHSDYVTSLSNSSGNPPPTIVYTDQNSIINTTHTIYKSNRIYLFLGVSLMLLSLALIMPLFWEFWKLGRRVSLSPLELATALHTSGGSAEAKVNVFEATKASLEGNTLSNANTGELVRAMGDIKVRYGQVAPGTLGLGVEDAVEPPNEGAVYL